MGPKSDGGKVSRVGNGYETSLILARNGLLTYATMRNLVKGEKLKLVAEKEKLSLIGLLTY